MPEPSETGPTASIQKRIDAAKAEREPAAKQDQPVSQAHVAWRMVVDLVVGTGLGAAAGYGLDVLFGTMPLFLAALTLLGFAGGVNLMLRTARELTSKDGVEGADED